MELVVESASVAHGLPVLVAPPQRRVGRLAVGADGALALGGGLQRQTSISLCIENEQTE